jgi:hypothetical protein
LELVRKFLFADSWFLGGLSHSCRISRYWREYDLKRSVSPIYGAMPTVLLIPQI